MGNLPAKVTGRYQSYDINTPHHMTPPMTIRRHNNNEIPYNNSNNNNTNNFQQFQQQKKQEIDSNTLPNPNLAAKTTITNNEEQYKQKQNRIETQIQRTEERDSNQDETGSVKLNKSIDGGNHSFGVEDDENEINSNNKAIGYLDSDREDSRNIFFRYISIVLVYISNSKCFFHK